MLAFAQSIRGGEGIGRGNGREAEAEAVAEERRDVRTRDDGSGQERSRE